MLEHRIITIETGRDAGKVYRVTEMPASKLEKWAARALLALFAGDVPADVVQMARGSNAAALVGNVMSGLGSLRWEDVEPLYDELLTCVARVPDPGRPEVVVCGPRPWSCASVFSASAVGCPPGSGTPCTRKPPGLRRAPGLHSRAGSQGAGVTAGHAMPLQPAGRAGSVRDRPRGRIQRRTVECLL